MSFIFLSWLSDLNIKNSIKIKILERFKFEVGDKGACEDIKYFIKSVEEELKLKKTKFEDYLVKNQETRSLGVNFVDFFHEKYPKNLKYISDPPVVIYYLGDIEALNTQTNISLIGSRKNTIYGERVVRKITTDLKGACANIVSGGAIGIDSLAHSYSLKNKLKTFAVLGSGLDIWYPYSNKKLFDDIIKNGGAILSEYSLGTKPYRYNFPRRNRIISGLCKVLLIIEAGEKSGSLITAGQALEQGRDVMVVPGSIFSSNSVGCNKLIYEGAQVYNDIQDLISLLDLQFVELKYEVKNCKNKLEEEQIQQFISDVPIHIDELKELTGFDIRVLYSLLFDMQMKEKLDCINGNFYVKSAR